MFNSGELGSLSNDSPKPKDEQNIKRRVYDALNVLISAGVLSKNGKYVISNKDAFCQQVKFSGKGLKKEDPQTLSLQILIKENIIDEKKLKIEELRSKK